MPRRARRRFELSHSEREDALALYDAGLRPVEVLRVVARAPRLVPEVVRAALRGAKDAVWNDMSIVAVVDAERVRNVVPDAASGAAWFDADFFLPTLLERLRPDLRVLDLGCGGGRLARLVAPHVRELVAADPSAYLLAEARENLDGIANVRFARTSAFVLDGFEDASFDAVFSHGVFSYLDLNQALAVFAEVRRILRPAGPFLLNVFTIDKPAWAAGAVADAREAARLRRFHAFVRRPYTSTQIEALLTAAGFCSVERIQPQREGWQGAIPAVFVAQSPPATGSQ
jgi:SAM-dependent methyltransferase